MAVPGSGLRRGQRCQDGAGGEGLAGAGAGDDRWRRRRPRPELARVSSALN